MLRLPFQTVILLAPLAYALHHAEENLLLDFRVWRLLYFADNNGLSTEAIFVILTAITLVYILLFLTLRTRESVWMIILFLMGSQVNNVIFHLGGTIIFWDYSPGLITGLLLYVPTDIIIFRAALREGYVTPASLWGLFFAGGAAFWAFEQFGPIVMPIFVIATIAWVLLTARKGQLVET